MNGRAMPFVGIRLGLLMVLGLFVPTAWAATQPEPATTPLTAETIVAKVGGEAIYARDVERMLKRATRGQQVNPAALAVLRSQLLEELVNRRLVLSAARRERLWPAETELQAALEQFKTDLKAQGRALEEYLQAESCTIADVRRQLLWSRVWEKYRERYLSDARLREYFEQHRRDFDGTQVAVSHILLRPAAGAGPEAFAALTRQAVALREEILGGKLTFAEAAKRFSVAPSATDGGRLGWISRRGSMDEALARAAFALQPGQLSPPVRSRFGVHLIRCEEVKPGTKSWRDVRQELEAAAARELLAKLAQAERQHTPVEITGPIPLPSPDVP
jgi:parvulin-like peptidyl-prolyl isomerase